MVSVASSASSRGVPSRGAPVWEPERYSPNGSKVSSQANWMVTEERVKVVCHVSLDLACVHCCMGHTFTVLLGVGAAAMLSSPLNGQLGVGVVVDAASRNLWAANRTRASIATLMRQTQAKAQQRFSARGEFLWLCQLRGATVCLVCCCGATAAPWRCSGSQRDGCHCDG